MFSKSKEPEIAPAPLPTPKARVGRAGVPSIISGDLTVKGTLVSGGDVQVDGRVEGDIRAAALVIGEKAVIEGDIYAEDAIIRGIVNGGIRARKVQLCATCRVQGNILHEALAVEAGAFFEGNCRHSDNPLAEDADHLRRVAQQTQVLERRPVQNAPQAVATPLRANGGAPEDNRQPQRPAAEFKPLKA